MDACRTAIKHLFHFWAELPSLMFAPQTKSCFAYGECYCPHQIQKIVLQKSRIFSFFGGTPVLDVCYANQVLFRLRRMLLPAPDTKDCFTVIKHLFNFWGGTPVLDVCIANKVIRFLVFCNLIFFKTMLRKCKKCDIIDMLKYVKNLFERAGRVDEKGNNI